jgi:LmbE family N-acetylglucosaminyl deacetylase
MAAPQQGRAMTYTVVSFHAHPDDEALLTAGTLAKAAAAGHRVVLVVATSGEAGLTAVPGAAEAGLAGIRSAELHRSAAAIGCHRVIELGYPDSGMAAEHGGFSAVPVESAAAVLAEILRAERADVLTTYDRNGGYGHPDHVQVHRVGQLAAELAGTPLVLEATVNRAALVRCAQVLHWTRLVPRQFTAERMRSVYAAPDTITHRIDVREHATAKRDSMRAHLSQTTGGSGPRTLAVLVRLPRWLFARALGTEWFIQPGRPGGGLVATDIFQTLP